MDFDRVRTLILGNKMVFKIISSLFHLPIKLYEPNPISNILPSKIIHKKVPPKFRIVKVLRRYKAKKNSNFKGFNRSGLLNFFI